jgi:hypothetical protein
MNVRRLTTSRSHRRGLLTRPPTGHQFEPDWSTWIVDPVAQLGELADLRDRGLLSLEEYELQKARVLEG